MSNAAAASAAPSDRRKRVALRRLIDEMLAEIRAAANEENWTSDARAQAESDLARIMDQVRREAMRAEPKPKAKRAKPR
jgi:ribosome recycling factor